MTFITSCNQNNPHTKAGKAPQKHDKIDIAIKALYTQRTDNLNMSL